MSHGRAALPPGATLGMLGGGQLGRMAVHAAQRLGYRVVVLDPDAHGPAAQAADETIAAAYDDPDGLDALAARCDAITTEFENVPAATLERLARTRPVAPAAAAVAVCQNRAAEKSLFARIGLPTVDWAAVDDAAALGALTGSAGRLAALLPGILKTAGLGYDGKGQRTVVDADGLRAAWHALGGVPCVLERRIELAGEASVVVARGADGALVHLPPSVNRHRDGILASSRTLFGDAGVLGPALRREAIDAARGVAEALDYVGVLCLELFIDGDGRLCANEMAPRPHNSGHGSIDGCDVSQFDLQVRTLAGLPLVAPRLHSATILLNLLGDLWAGGEPAWADVLALPGAHLHLYGKRDARPGRKMGHLTLTAADDAAVEALAAEAARRLGLPRP